MGTSLCCMLRRRFVSEILLTVSRLVLAYSLVVMQEREVT
jgi:hypothetical protein